MRLGGFLREILRVNLISRAAPLPDAAALGALGADGSRVVSPCRRHDVENQPIDDVVHGVARGAGRAVASTRRRGGGGANGDGHGARARPVPRTRREMAPERVAAEAGKRQGKAADARRPRRDEVRENVHPGLRFPGRQRPRLVPSRFAHASAPLRRLPQPPRCAFQRHRTHFFLLPLPLYRLRRPARVARLVFRRGAPPRFRHPSSASARPRAGEAASAAADDAAAAPSRPSRPRRPPRPARQDDDPVGTVVAGLGRAAIRGSRPERDERRQRVRRRRRGYEPTPAERDARRRRAGRRRRRRRRRRDARSALLLGRRRQNRRLGRFPHRDERWRGGRHRRESRRRVRSVRARARARTIGSRSRASRRSRRRRRRRRFRRESRALLSVASRRVLRSRLRRAMVSRSAARASSFEGEAVSGKREAPSTRRPSPAS